LLFALPAICLILSTVEYRRVAKFSVPSESKGFVMLVLSRKKHESVVLADEVTLTVEGIQGGDGQYIPGASVRLGFQSPRYVSVYRSELRAKRSGTSRPGKTAEPARPPAAGRSVEVSDARVGLQIQLPRNIPVCCNGTRSVGLDLEEKCDGETHASKAVHRITCRKEDRITICNNINITTLDFRSFVFF